MEVIKRKILINKLEDKIYLKIPLYQSMDNLGLLTDYAGKNTRVFGKASLLFGPQIAFPALRRRPTIANSDVTSENGSKGYYFNYQTDYVVSRWYEQGDKIVSASDSKLNQLKTYDANQQYKIDFNIKKENYVNYLGTPITGVDRITNISGETVTYVFDATRDSTIGTTGQTTGILYQDNPIDGVDIPEELDSDVTGTRVQYMSEGWNKTNTSLDPQIQEEYLLGIISQPEVESDVFIDRSTFSVLDKHLRLSEVESLDHLTRYGNGFYNINRD